MARPLSRSETYSRTLSMQLWNWMASRIFAMAGPMMPVCRRLTQYFRPLSMTYRSAATLETA